LPTTSTGAVCAQAVPAIKKVNTGVKLENNREEMCRCILFSLRALLPGTKREKY
jgi:hypothetical protein